MRVWQGWGWGERMSWFISLCMARAATEKFIKTTGLINTIDGVRKSTNTYTHTHTDTMCMLKQMFWYVSNIQMNCESVTALAECVRVRECIHLYSVYILYMKTINWYAPKRCPKCAYLAHLYAILSARSVVVVDAI